VELTQFVDSNEKFGQYWALPLPILFVFATDIQYTVYSIQYTVYRHEFEIRGNLQRRQTAVFQAFQQVSAQRNRKKYSKQYLQHAYVNRGK
jgi:hypothetical protein